MTVQQKEKAGNILMIVVTAFIAWVSAWGAMQNRVATLEGNIHEVKPVLLRIDLSLARIEQCITDYDRRLTRLEK